MSTRDDEAWQANLKELKKYKKKHKHCRVPPKFETACGKKLGIWVVTQRTAYKQGKLSQDRLDALNAIGFSWNVLEEDWQEKFEMLEKYVEEHGNCRVPFRHEVLGGWVHNQRTHHSKLSDDRITKLNSVGFIWDASKFTSKAKRDQFLVSPPPAQGQGRSQRNNKKANAPSARLTPNPNRNRKTGRGTSSSETSSPAPKRRKTETRDTETENLRKLVAQQKKTIAQQKEAISELEEENHTQGETIVEQDLEIQSNVKTVSDLEEENRNKDKEIDQLKKTIADQEKDIHRKDGTIAKLVEDKEELEKEKKKATKKVSNLLPRVEELEKLPAKLAALARQDEILEGLEKTNEKRGLLPERVSDLEKLNLPKRVAALMTSRGERIAELEEEEKESARKNWEGLVGQVVELEKLPAQLVALERNQEEQIVALQEGNQKKDARIVELEVANKKLEASATTIENLEATVKALEEAAESEKDSSNSTKKLQATILRLQEEVESQKASNNKKDDEIQEQKENSKMLQTQAASLMECHQNVTSTIKKLEEDRESLRAKYKGKLEKMRKDHEEALEKLHQEIEELTVANNGQTTRIAEQEKTINKKHARLTRLQETARNKEQQLVTIKEEPTSGQEQPTTEEDTDDSSTPKRKDSQVDAHASAANVSKASA